MKIKTKKQMNLPQLIEWGWGNPSLSRNKRFFSKDENLGITKHCVHFNDFGYPEVDNRYCLEPTDTFTFTIEEEITEDIVFEEILLIVNNGLGIEVYSNHSINDVLSNNEGYYEETVMLILKPNPEVIWTREKGLVE